MWQAPGSLRELRRVITSDLLLALRITLQKVVNHVDLFWIAIVHMSL